MSTILNIAAYKFVPLDDLPGRRRSLMESCRQAGLKGTILLSPEGINMFLAGQVEPLRGWLEVLKQDPLFADLEVKESFSDDIPFNRMLVKLKREIIAFGIEGIAPHRQTSPKLPARQLKQWLDEGREVVMLDVRNDFEVKVGTFETAVPIGVDHFRQFEQAVDRLPNEMRDKPVVMFCTGGIRCEKAGPLMERKGFSQIYQLEGGILKYFEEVGGDHYQGGCFVFDDRVAVGPQLEVTGLALCYACQQVLSPEEQQSPQYVEGESCPHCFRDQSERMREVIAARHQAIQRLTHDLPGSQPHDQRRPIRIPERCEGMTLLDVVDQIFPQIGREQWQATIEAGRILEGSMPVRAVRKVRAGEQFIHLVPEFIEPLVNAAIEILWEDDAMLVVNKPAPLPVHPSGRYNHNTLIGLLNLVYAPQVLKAAHRLDANTRGITVLGRSREVTRRLQQQFENRTVDKVYRAVCHGHPQDDTFVSQAPIGILPGEGRIRIADWQGQPAKTEFRVLERREDGTSLIEARPITGRTNQIRVHLWDAGHAIVGDPLYLPGRQLGDNRTLATEERPMELQACQLSFRHPETDEPLTFKV